MALDEDRIIAKKTTQCFPICKVPYLKKKLVVSVSITIYSLVNNVENVPFIIYHSIHEQENKSWKELQPTP